LDFIAYLENFTFWQWLAFSLVSNFLLYLFSIGLYVFIDKTCSKEKIQQQDFPITTSDTSLTLLTVILNAVVMLIAVYFWKMNWLVLNESKSIFAIIVEMICITIVMDFLMYCFHYLAHLPFIYKILHRKHHEHISTNYLSLFVLHPFETLGFGMMMIAVFMCYNFSIISISAYLFINLIWGTIGHLNREFFPKWTQNIFLGTTKFHNLHHLNERYNFGFYTSIWDHLFQTYKN